MVDLNYNPPPDITMDIKVVAHSHSGILYSNDNGLLHTGKCQEKEAGQKKHTVERLQTNSLLFVHLLKSIYIKFQHKKPNQADVFHQIQATSENALLTPMLTALWLVEGQGAILPPFLPPSLRLCFQLLFAFPRWSGS